MRIDSKRFPGTKAILNAYQRGQWEYLDAVEECVVNLAFGIESVVLPIRFWDKDFKMSRSRTIVARVPKR